MHLKKVGGDIDQNMLRITSKIRINSVHYLDFRTMNLAPNLKKKSLNYRLNFQQRNFTINALIITFFYRSPPLKCNKHLKKNFYCGNNCMIHVLWGLRFSNYFYYIFSRKSLNNISHHFVSLYKQVCTIKLKLP